MGLKDADLFSGGSRLNFDPEVFLSDDFSVDSFIQHKRQTVPLDVLRDDLGSHLKTLRSSLIELINQDYGQFVNLSSNLVGLDGRIQSIVGPFTRTRNDLQNFNELLEGNISQLSQELQTRRNIRETKAQIQYLRMTSTALDSSSRLVAKLSPEIVTSMDFCLLRSACDEIAETKFLLQCCSPSPIQKQLLTKWDGISKEVLSRINGLLKAYADTKDLSEDSKSIVKSLLYMYTELQCESEVEDVLTREVLGPKFETVLTKKGNVGALFDSVEAFLKQSPVISMWRNLIDYPWMAKYDFIGKGIFPSVFSILCKHFPHIWSPSNPESFHSNWKRCEQFLVILEDSMPSLEHLESFRGSDALKEFNAKWQFPVYFQLRFHTLATELESALEDLNAPCATSDFKLDATRIMVKVLNQCWDNEKIYVAKISSRFLKASALVISRYLTEIKVKIASNKSTPIQLLVDTYSDLNLAELTASQILSEKMMQELKLSRQDSNDPSEVTENVREFLCGFSWNEVRGAIENSLVEITVSQSVSNISAVNEVPRLYRRTNRDNPTKALEYVDSMLLQASSLKNEIHKAHQDELWDNIAEKIGPQVLQRYKAQVQEVLVSVQRMEESLRRLKKVKGQNSSNDSNKGLTDDDKIRLQIQLDVKYFVQKMKEICPTVDVLPIEKLSSESMNGIK